MDYDHPSQMIGSKQFPILVPRPCTNPVTSTDGIISITSYTTSLGDNKVNSLASELDYTPSISMYADSLTNSDVEVCPTITDGDGNGWPIDEQTGQYYISPPLIQDQSDSGLSCPNNNSIWFDRVRWTDEPSVVRSKLRQWYRHALAAMHQTVCKRVAKIWIAAIEPGKVGTCPYERNVKRGRVEQPAPDWWPSDVPFIGPDRMQTNGR